MQYQLYCFLWWDIKNRIKNNPVNNSLTTVNSIETGHWNVFSVLKKHQRNRHFPQYHRWSILTTFQIYSIIHITKFIETKGYSRYTNDDNNNKLTFPIESWFPSWFCRNPKGRDDELFLVPYLLSKYTWKSS